MTVQRVGGEDHEREHRARHSTLYAPLFQFAFGDVATWGTKRACVLFAGEGREAAILAPFVHELWVTDDTEECLAVMRSRFAAERRVHVSPANVGTDALPYASIDILTGLVTLMHIGAASVRDHYAREIKRLLSPTGRALVQVMAGEGYWHGSDHPYGNPDVGFRDDHEVTAYWAQYAPVQWVLRAPAIPVGRAEPCWWWVCLGSDVR